MIGIREIASFVPNCHRDNFTLASQFEETEDFVRNRLGGHILPVLEPGMETSDLAVNAIAALLDKTGVDKKDVQCLIVCTQNPDGRGLPHTSAIVQKKIGLPVTIAAFDVSLGCSGYVYGLNIVKGFMEAAGLQNGIFVTADPYSKIVDPKDRNTIMLFGDAATATLLSGDNPVLNVGNSVYCTDGCGSEHLCCLNDRLYMNGRQVFNFAATRVPQQIKKLLDAEGLQPEEIDQYILHQGSRYIVETLSGKLHLDRKKVPLKMEKTGNTVSSSIPLVLEETLIDQTVRKILIAGFGVGWSWGSMILERNIITSGGLSES